MGKAGGGGPLSQGFDSQSVRAGGSLGDKSSWPPPPFGTQERLNWGRDLSTVQPAMKRQCQNTISVDPDPESRRASLFMLFMCNHEGPI